MQMTGLEQGLLYTALGIFGAATFVAGQVVTGKRAGRRLRPMLVAGTVALTVLLLVVAIRQGRVPASSRAEVLLVAAWCLALGAGAIDRKQRSPVLLAVAAPTLAVLTLFGLLLALRPGIDETGAIQQPFTAGVTAHILLAIVGLAAFTFAAGVGAYYLWQIRELKRRPKIALSHRVPPLELLDRLNYGAAAFGFPFLALSVLGVWLFSGSARVADGNWLRDPTVLVTLGGLLVYLALFGARACLGWRGRRIAWLTVAGFVVIVVGLVVAAYCTSPGVMHTS
ncbi:MAG: cytochrome c biogenesis protein CcsA [Planctomycetota bacterium]|jgi:ABC-type transport system involved in cytochrome c biogenesis permease subunit